MIENVTLDVPAKDGRRRRVNEEYVMRQPRIINASTLDMQTLAEHSEIREQIDEIVTQSRRMLEKFGLGVDLRTY